MQVSPFRVIRVYCYGFIWLALVAGWLRDGQHWPREGGNEAEQTTNICSAHPKEGKEGTYMVHRCLSSALPGEVSEGSLFSQILVSISPRSQWVAKGCW